MSATILIVDDEENARLNIGNFLTSRGFESIGVATLAEARESLRLGKADIILLDVQLPDGYGPSLLEETASMPLRPPIILITAYGDIDMAVGAMKSGAHDFLQKPISLAQLEKSILRAGEIVAMRRELAHLRQTQQEELDFIIGSTLQDASAGRPGPPRRRGLCLGSDHRRDRHRQRGAGESHPPYGAAC